MQFEWGILGTYSIIEIPNVKWIPIAEVIFKKKKNVVDSFLLTKNKNKILRPLIGFECARK